MYILPKAKNFPKPFSKCGNIDELLDWVSKSFTCLCSPFQILNDPFSCSMNPFEWVSKPFVYSF